LIPAKERVCSAAGEIEMTGLSGNVLGVLAAVTVDPSTNGMPGARFIQQLLNWLSQVALWGSLASILCGAAIYGISQHTANYAGASKGKYLALAGVIGASLAGLAPTAVNLLFNAAKS
jgi:hypothetical protein